MRNFYKTLQIPFFSTTEAIRNKVKSSKFSPEIEAILLNANRRRVYDRAWNCLSIIAPLRANLGLNESQHWKANHSDFSVAHDGYLPLISQIVEVSKERQEKTQSKSTLQKNPDQMADSGKISKWIFIAVLCAPVLVGLFTCSGEKSYSPEQRPPVQNSSGSLPPFSEQSSFRQQPPSSSLGNMNFLPTEEQLAEYAAQKPSLKTKLKPKSRPQTGRLTGKGKAVAPFSIVTPYGMDYYIKLENVDTQKTIMTAYIRGGDIFDTKVPVGNYILKYASGKQWYGTKSYFGDDTTFSKANEIFSFKRTYDGYEGYTVELVLQRNGNLHTSGISRDNF